MQQQRELIEVRTERELPAVLKWRGRLHIVDKISRAWVVTGMVWRGEQDKEYFRVITTTNTMMDLYRTGSEWTLTRVYE